MEYFGCPEVRISSYEWAAQMQPIVVRSSLEPGAKIITAFSHYKIL